MGTFKVVLHRVNPDTRFCDDTGRKSCYFDSSLGFYYLKEKVEQNFKKQLKYNPNYDFFDFDSDVYFVTITNLVTNKTHYIVK